MTEIIPGIHQLKIPIPNNPLECTNVYLLRGDDGYLMIDTGWNSDQAMKSLKEQLAEIGIRLKDISQIVLTHCHADHYGLTGRLKKQTQATISIHYIERDLLTTRAGDMREFMRRSEGWFNSNGVPADSFPIFRMTPSERRRLRSPAMPDITFRGDETISTGVFNLKLFWTPGHSPGHICLYERDRKILFTGDHVLPVITPNVSLQPHSEGNPLGDFLSSLGTLRQLDVDVALPAHERIFYDLKKRIDEITLHHRRRNSEIESAINSGPKTAYQISDAVTWMPDFGGVSFKDLTPWLRRMAVSETLAHLKFMEVEGTVEKNRIDDIIYYRLNHH